MHLSRTCSLNVRKRSFFALGGFGLAVMLCYLCVHLQEGTPNHYNCTGYYELASVNFFDDKMRKRLCVNQTAFTIENGRFPLCQLTNHLPEEIEQEVRREAIQDYVESKIDERNVTIYRYRDVDIVSRYIARKHSWEPALVSRLIKIMKLLSSSDVTFLDIGSNIGVYSLQAIDAGFSTIAVDANIRNLARMQLSVSQSRQQHLMRMFWAFFHTQVSIRYLEFDSVDCNIGGGSGFDNQAKSISDTVPVATAVGDDLIPHIKTRFVVMKIDVETSERVFFETSGRLLQERQVAVVQMEWWRKSLRDSAATSPNHRYLVDFFSSRNYVLMSPFTLERLNPETFRDWDTIWVRWDFVHLVKKTLVSL